MSIFNISQKINALTKDIQAYMQSSAEYYKLDIFSKLMKGAVSLVNLLVIGSIFLVVLMLLIIFGKPLISKIVLQKYSKIFFNEGTQKEVLDEEFKHLTK